MWENQILKGLLRPLDEISIRANGSLEDVWGGQNNMDTLQYDTLFDSTLKASLRQ